MGGGTQPTLVSGKRNQLVEERRAAYERLLFIAMFAWPPFGALDVLGARHWHHEQSVPGVITLRVIGAVLLAVAYGAVRWGGLGSTALTILDVSLCVLLATAYLIDRVGRKRAYAVGFLFGAAMLFAVMGMSSPGAMTVLALAMVASLGLSIVPGTLGMYTAENYPNHLRAVGSGVSSIPQRLSSVVGPYLVGLMLPGARDWGAVPNRGHAPTTGSFRAALLLQTCALSCCA